MKNSEWGAVAYLTHSQYGRNGNEIRINNNNSFLTGSAAKTKDESSSTDTNSYNTTDGMLASSTGNITGIYDLSGGAGEYVSAFNNEDTNDCFTSFGSSFASTSKSSDEYATQYINSGSSGNAITAVYSTGKTGDATKEVRTNNNSRNWCGDYSLILRSVYPFFVRGSSHSSASGAGVFSSAYSNGNSLNHNSFRIVLAH